MNETLITGSDLRDALNKYADASRYRLLVDSFGSEEARNDIFKDVLGLEVIAESIKSNHTYINNISSIEYGNAKPIIIK